MIGDAAPVDRQELHPRALAVALRTEVAALADAVDQARLGNPVPACPGMTVRDLVEHVTTVHRHVTRWVTGGARPSTGPAPDGPGPADTGPADTDPADTDPADDPVDRYRTG
ncbi:maleylpyruvate isomerase N-terminal domain-containing protein, partial [Saccharothrix sp. MB29]|nr:maleylpyruvate isomerase N-terminal domain-containing protein [Saccharothrix sp. MB29]